MAGTAGVTVAGATDVGAEHATVVLDAATVVLGAVWTRSFEGSSVVVVDVEVVGAVVVGAMVVVVDVHDGAAAPAPPARPTPSPVAASAPAAAIVTMRVRRFMIGLLGYG